MGKARAGLISEVSSKRDCDGDGARTHGKRECQREEGMIEGVLERFGACFAEGASSR